jgi:Flp pilus assembly protein TadD
METHRHAILAATLLGGLALLLYVNTIHHDFALDDSIVIAQNQFTQEGLAGVPKILTHDSFEGWRPGGSSSAGGRYRPLSLLTFALEVECFGLNAGRMHTFNVVLYALCAILLFVVLRTLLGTDRTALAFLASLLFVAHPLHTEVVANIKSRDELLCLIFLLATLLAAIRYTVRPGAGMLLGTALCFALALLAKEMALSGIVLIPLALWTFGNTKPRTLGAIAGGLGAALLAYIIMRGMAIGFPGDRAPTDILSNPFVNASLSERYATVFLVLGKYLGLLVLPHPLLWDYSYRHIEVVDWASPLAFVSLVLHLLLAAYVVIRIRLRDVAAFGILFYLVSLFTVSNLVLPVGGIMAERFLFIPSLGFCLIVAHFLLQIVRGAFPARRTRSISLTILFGALVFAYGTKTVLRNADWKDNLTLFRADILHNPTSVRARNALGESLMEAYRAARDPSRRAQLHTQAINEFRAALDLHRDARTHALLASAYREHGRLREATEQYEKCLEADPQHFHAVNALAAIKFAAKDYVAAGALYAHARSLRPEDSGLALSHAATLEKQDRTDEAITEYLQAVAKPEEALAAAGRAQGAGVEDLDDLNRLGSFYVGAGHYETAAKTFHRATIVAPGAVSAHNNLASLYAISNQFGMASYHFQMALRAEPESTVTKQNLSSMLVVWGRELFDEERYTNALVKMRQAVQFNPENAEAMLLLGTCHFQLGRFDTAIDAYKYALTLDPTNREIYHWLASVYRRKGDIDTANAILRASMRLSK